MKSKTNKDSSNRAWLRRNTKKPNETKSKINDGLPNLIFPTMDAAEHSCIKLRRKSVKPKCKESKTSSVEFIRLKECTNEEKSGFAVSEVSSMEPMQSLPQTDKLLLLRMNCCSEGEDSV